MRQFFKFDRELWGNAEDFTQPQRLLFLCQNKHYLNALNHKVIQISSGLHQRYDMMSAFFLSADVKAK
jgi:hypothetical protein